jgi:hypothetical protein
MTRVALGLAIFVMAVGIGADSAGPAVAARAIQAKPPSHDDVMKEARAKSLSKDWSAAAALWQRVVEMNPNLQRNWVQLSNALYQAREYRKAIAAYQKVAELGAGYPWDPPYNIACCYALMGEKEQALKWLERALNLGFRDLRHAQTDEDFASIRNDPKYRDLVALVDTGKMTRDEGWRFDTMFLAREIKRIHYDPFRTVSREEFDACVKRLYDEVPRLSDQQILVRLMALMKMPGDAHTNLRMAHAGNGGLPVQFYLFTEGLFIVAAAPQHADLLGTQVLKVGETPVARVLEKLDTVISQDNAIWPKLIGPNLMRYPQVLNGLGLSPDPGKITVTVRDRNDKTWSATLTGDGGMPSDDWVTARKDAGVPEPLYLKNRRASYWFEYLPDSKTVYFQYNSVQNDLKDPLSGFCDRLFKFIDDNPVDRLVIDMRWNGGGNNFLNRPIVHGLIRNDKIKGRGKLFVIVGRQTFSAAMNGATDIERNTDAIFVGEPTGSRPNFVGETVRVELPYSKLQGSISDLYWQSSVAMDYRTWIAPQIYAPPSFELYRANRDPAMEAILAYRGDQ